MVTSSRKGQLLSRAFGELLFALSEIHLNQTCNREMARDPDVYSKPEEFDPSRFQGPHPERDPALYVFGFGRRWAFQCWNSRDWFNNSLWFSLCPGELEIGVIRQYIPNLVVLQAFWWRKRLYFSPYLQFSRCSMCCPTKTRQCSNYQMAFSSKFTRNLRCMVLRPNRACSHPLPFKCHITPREGVDIDELTEQNWNSVL